MCSPSISIVIPTYKGNYLSETVESVLSQTLSNWELVIVDDGSPDATLAVAEGYARRDPRIRALRIDNGGESRARNAGLAQISSSSSFVIFLDHDDLWESDALQVLHDALEEAPEALGAYGIGQFVDPSNTPCQPGELENWCRLRKRLSGRRFLECGKDELTTLDTICYHMSISTPGVCLLRRALLPVGELFKPEMRTGSGDFHLWMRLARKGGFMFVDRCILRGRRHSNNMTNQHRLIDRSVLDAYLDFLALPDTYDEHRSVLLRAYRARWHDKAKECVGQSVHLLMHGRMIPAVKELARAARNLGRSLRGLPTRGHPLSGPNGLST